jgi:hypothetical protein
LAFVSSIFKYFLKSPKKRKIRVCLKNLRVCHYYVENSKYLFLKEIPLLTRVGHQFIKYHMEVFTTQHFMPWIVWDFILTYMLAHFLELSDSSAQVHHFELVIYLACVN